MLTEILPIVENACSLKEGSSTMDPNCAVEELLGSQQSCEPFSVTYTDPCKNLVAPEISGAEVIVGAFNSISIVELSGQRDDEGKDKVKFDDFPVIKGPDTVCSSPSRSAHMTESNQKTQARKDVKKCRKTVVKKPSFDSVLLKLARKRRSYLCKRVRSSVWGSLGSIAQFFEQNIGVDVNQNGPAKSHKGRGVRRSGKRDKNHSRRSKGTSLASSGRIRLKIKLGKEEGKNCLSNMVSTTGNGLRNCRETSIGVPILDDGSENMFKEEVPGFNGYLCCNGDQGTVVMSSEATHLDMCIANNLEIPVICEKSSVVETDNQQIVPSQITVEELGVAVDNGCLDSGTSPDSEVINLIPESQVNGEVQGDFYNVLISPHACNAPGDATSLVVSQISCKKGKKKNKIPHADNFGVEDRLPVPEIINNATVLETRGQRQKMGDVFNSRETSISTSPANVSCNTSSCEGFSRGRSSSSRAIDSGVTSENLKVEGGREEDMHFRLRVSVESPESNISEKLHPCTKTKDRKHLKSSKSRGVNKSGSKISDSPRSQGENSFRQKGNPMKLVSKRKVKDKAVCDEVVCKVENHPDTGDHSSADPGKIRTGDESTTNDILNLDNMPKCVGEQHIPQRSAWVCCDDCLKWRRIPATLADSIEETNGRWTCKDNMDKGFADCSIPQEKSNSEINAELEISDASCEEDGSNSRSNSKRLEPRYSTVHQQSTWMLIRSNMFLHRNRKKQTIDEIMVCHCKPPPDGKMGCGDGCLNRMLNIECVKGTCPCRELCSNQQFQKHKYAKLSWFPCGKKGYGLQLLEDISEGQFLIEYVGEVLDVQAYEARQREYASMGHKHFYFMTLNGSEVIDACAKGNLGRFINHSCDPNCRTEKWMVNGEVCIGLFALRDIKKGSEVTFDYNYVRVFGAAAKKCVCGSSQCRGIIGGDPQNTEVIVQGDSDEEYPEPVMLYEDGKIDDSSKPKFATSSFYGTNMQLADNKLGNKGKTDKSATAAAHLEGTTELQAAGLPEKVEDENDRSATAVQQLEIMPENSISKSASGTLLLVSREMDESGEKLQSVMSVETSSQLDDLLNKTISDAQQEFVRRLETSAMTVSSSKQLSDTLHNNNKVKSDAIEERRDLKSRPRMKTSRSSSLVKKGKLKSNTPNVDKSELMINKSHVLPYKPRKTVEGSLNGRFEAVEEKLNELLDADGGISKRKDSPKGYLKLLLLTATSGGSGHGEAIQSNRDLSMILDALLKTKSRMVLLDIINKNGLQMLHNIMKRYRREFNKIPILRKLLKVLEYLAVREILTLEHINGGPPCPGVESFRESILRLTDHDNKQVHQIARIFRDRWIPKPARRSSCMDRSDGRVESLWDSNGNRYNHGRDQVVKSTEAINGTKESSVATNSVDAGTPEGCSASGSSGCPTNGTRTRKRKSRWDQPAEINTDVGSPQHKEPKIEPSFLQKSHSVAQPELGKVVLAHINGINREESNADDGGQNNDEDVPDVPPGFFPLNAPSVPSNASSTVTDIHQGNGIPSKFPGDAVMGHPNGRFNNRLAVSYGIPLPVVQQFGVPQAETLESWIVAPGMPFHPFPPLPQFPRDMRESPPCAGNSDTIPSTSGTRPPDTENQSANNQNSFNQVRNSYSLGRRFFKQKKWNNPQVRPPWNQKRNGWGFSGNNSRNGMCSVGPNSSEYVNTGAESVCNTYQQYPQQQNFH
ncbi:histone-lysine N-methyltransferase ASHH2-like [Actinidia eriantha]|uniref:histone-lysine N-methyltransferase ASHH2-like n=1 Tax=Actinidia eriantha TaxID=165200 RepID=UPI00258AF29E|nr:histone-lysine N-methyltransferase ASHH2-like [Actinidia eriantha]